MHSVTGPQHQTSATCNATFSTIHARQVAEKIAQCNRALNVQNKVYLSPCQVAMVTKFLVAVPELIK